jgi:hypothetical protein
MDRGAIPLPEFIFAAWPGAMAKSVARALGCSLRTGIHIAGGEREPRWALPKLRRAIRAAILARRDYLDALILQLDREIACDEAAATMAGSNRAAADRRDPVGDRRVRDMAA